MSMRTCLRTLMASAVVLLLGNFAGAADGTQASGDDPFSLFHSNSKGAAEEAPKPKSTTASTPKSTSSSSGSSSTMSVYCSGTAQQYTGPMATFSDSFEFRSNLNFGADKHQVINVLKGKIFRSGATYDLMELPNDVVILGAESTDAKWQITTIKLDLAVGKMSGDGKVDLSSVRGRLRQRLNEMSPASGDSISEGGLDDSRSVKLEGTCIKL